MKKTLAIILALIALCAGCGTQNAPSGDTALTPGPSATPDASPVEISILQHDADIDKALEKAIESYKAVAPNVNITLETVEDFRSALDARLNEGGPTIFNIEGPADVERYGGYLADLSGEEWTAAAFDGLLAPVTKEGGVYGAPYSAEAVGLVYNKEIFDSADVDTMNLNTLDNLRSALGELQEAINKGKLKDKYPLLEAVTEVPVKEPWVWGDHALNMPLGAEFGYDAQAAYAAEELKWAYGKGFKDYVDMMMNCSLYAQNWGKAANVDYAQQVSGGLAIERVAVIQQGSWVYDDVKNVDESVADKLSFMPLPVAGAKEDSIIVYSPMYWCVNKTSPQNEQEAAKAFLNWLYQSDEGKKIVAQDFGFIPPYNNYGDVTPKDPLSKKVLEFFENGRTAAAVFKGYPAGFAQAAGEKIQKYILGELKWDKFLSESAADWEKLRKEQSEEGDKPQASPGPDGSQGESGPDDQNSPQPSPSPDDGEPLSPTPDDGATPGDSETPVPTPGDSAKASPSQSPSEKPSTKPEA